MRTSALSRAVSAAMAFMLLMPFGGAFLRIEAAHADYPQCSDGIDNDHDGRIDYPEDPDCTSMNDDSESHDPGVFVTVTDGRDTVMPGGVLIYQITLKQQRSDVELVDVSFHVPAQNSIESASDDGSISNAGVVWRKV